MSKSVVERLSEFDPAAASSQAYCSILLLYLVGLGTFGSITLSPGVVDRELRGVLAAEKPDLKLIRLVE